MDEAPTLSPLLTTWRAEQSAWLTALGDPLTPAFDEALLARAKSLDSPSRTKIWENFREIEKIIPKTRTIAENKWCLTLISADRAELLKSKRADSAAAKKASTPKTPPVTMSLASLLGGNT